MLEKNPTDAEILQEQAHSLQKLIKEAQRIHEEITSHLRKIHHAGDQSAPNKKR
jgi:hypothetical protein